MQPKKLRILYAITTGSAALAVIQDDAGTPMKCVLPDSPDEGNE